MHGAGPILLTSPATRSGTTLLQRLLCSAANALIYGEEVGKDLDVPLQVLASRELVYRHGRDRFQAPLERLLAGDGDGWMVDLLPPLDGYLEALRAGVLAGLVHCGGHARAIGRPVWGFKYPGWSPPLLQMLQARVPSLRVVYVVRGLADTLRSAKAWHEFGDERESEAFCAQWLAHRRFMRDWAQAHPVLELRLEALLAAPADGLGALAEFTGARGMDAGVLARRINAGAGDAFHAPRDASGNLAPAALTPAETTLVAATEAALD